MNPTLHPPLPARAPRFKSGDPVKAFDHAHKGRINAVFQTSAGHYYRVAFAAGAPYFNDDAGVIYREHELSPWTGQDGYIPPPKYPDPIPNNEPAK